VPRKRETPKQREARIAAEEHEFRLLTWGVLQGRALANEYSLPPHVLWLIGQVHLALPEGELVTAFPGFVRRNATQLTFMVDTAFEQARPKGHPLDAYPPRVGVLHRSMSLEEAEGAMRSAAQEHVVIVNSTSGMQIARFGPEMTRAYGLDPAGLTVTDSRLNRHSRRERSWVLSHNHPACGILSGADLHTAATMDLLSVRAVCPDGWVWWCDRPPRGWPDPYTLEGIVEDAMDAAYTAASEHYCRTLGLPAGQEHRLPPGLDYEWQATFDRHAVEYINRAGRVFGLRVQGSGPSLPDGTARL
jgi:hypothetical protein